MKKEYHNEQKTAREWFFVYQAMLNGDFHAKKLFKWKSNTENIINELLISLSNHSFLSSTAKIKAISTILKLRRDERKSLNDFLYSRKPLIYLESIKRNRNKIRSNPGNNNRMRFNG